MYHDLNQQIDNNLIEQPWYMRIQTHERAAVIVQELKLFHAARVLVHNNLKYFVRNM